MALVEYLISLLQGTETILCAILHFKPFARSMRHRFASLRWKKIRNWVTDYIQKYQREAQPTLDDGIVLADYDALQEFLLAKPTTLLDFAFVRFGDHWDPMVRIADYQSDMGYRCDSYSLAECFGHHQSRRQS